MKNIDKDYNPFEELPEGLVEEMLSNSKLVSTNLLGKFNEIIESKGKIREKLEESGILKNYVS